MADREVRTTERRWKIDGGLVAAAMIIGIFLWAAANLIEKASYQ